MRTRIISALIALVISCLQVQAQYAGTKVQNRLGHGQDSILNFAVYNDFARQFPLAMASGKKADLEKCYFYWRKLMGAKGTKYVGAPFCTFNLTYYGSGGQMLLKLIDVETDPNKRIFYMRDLMEMCDFALENYQALNSIDDQKHPTYTKGVLMCWKAHFYKSLRDKMPEKAYNKEKAYNNYVDAFAVVRGENVSADAEMDPFYLEEYFEACRDLYESDKDKYLERFLTDYVSCLESCDKMMTVYHEADTLKWRGYAGTRNNIQVYFYQTGAGSPENLKTFYEPRIKEHKKDLEYLNNAVHIMFANGCIGEDIFYDACEAAYFLKPNYENSIGMGLMSQSIDGDRMSAKQYFDEARGLASTANEHYLAAKCTADALSKTPAPKKEEDESVAAFNARMDEWRNLKRGACIYYNEALDYAVQAAIPGQYLADVYYNLADCYRVAQDFSQASQCLTQAKLNYPAFSDERYNNMNSAIQKGLENKRAQEERYQAQLKNQAQLDAWKKKVAAQKAAQDAEAAFWSKK